jgi:eukaryotic-like serine/threonine-protein kinase
MRRLSEVLLTAACNAIDKVPALAELLDPLCKENLGVSGKVSAGKRHHSLPVTQRKMGSGATVILKVVGGPIQGESFVIERHNTFLFGRSRDCHVRITGDPRVSRHHFILEAVPPQARLRDLGSRNGTYVNGVRYGGRGKQETAVEAAGRRYPEIDLKHGDRIAVGRTTFEVRVASAPAASPPEEIAPRAASAPQHGPSGPRLPGYKIGEELGKGNLGTVYRGVRTAGRHQVAIKIAAPKIVTSEAERREFLRQLDPLRQLQHPGIVGLCETGLTE